MHAVRALSALVGAAARHLAALLGFLWRKSIWHPDAIPSDEHKYRNLKRVALPVYDGIAVTAGVHAVIYGSQLLNRIFDEQLLDAVGVTFSVVAVVCFLGVAFPALWAVEMAGKALLVGMVVGYVAAIWLYPTPTPSGADVPNHFVVDMLAFGLPLACFRLSMLGEEWWTRHVKRKKQETAA